MRPGALVLLMIAVAAGVLGFGGYAGDAAWMAKLLSIVFLAVFAVAMLTRRRA